MSLADDAEALAYDAAFWLVGFDEPETYELAELGVIAMNLHRKLRGLAIIALLTQGDVDKFCHTLIRSAMVHEVYLQRMRQAQNPDDHHLASGRIDPVLDALAAGDIELAHRIAWMSPRSWFPQREYEDDFCFAQVIHRLIHGVAAPAVYEPFLLQFERALNGQASPRMDVLHALVHKAQPDFDDAFDALLQARQAEIRKAIARAQIEDAAVLAERQVFIEGLALLRLADRQGMKTRGDYLYCPSLARRPMRTPLPPMPADS